MVDEPGGLDLLQQVEVRGADPPCYCAARHGQYVGRIQRTGVVGDVSRSNS